jgi:hypothetical protein
LFCQIWSVWDPSMIVLNYLTQAQYLFETCS